MRIVTVTHEVYAATLRMQGFGIDEGEGLQDAGGSWSFPISDEIYERLQGLKFEGESDSDTLARLIAFFNSGGKQ